MHPVAQPGLGDTKVGRDLLDRLLRLTVTSDVAMSSRNSLA